jgi:hypothetical protein
MKERKEGGLQRKEGGKKRSPNERGEGRKAGIHEETTTRRGRRNKRLKDKKRRKKRTTNGKKGGRTKSWNEDSEDPSFHPLTLPSIQ